VIGVDFSQGRLEKAQRLACERRLHPESIAADLLDYRPQPRAFDLVLISTYSYRPINAGR
jgi:hypothetical protein